MIDLVETLLWLCSIPSPTGHEGPLCDAIADRLRGVATAAPARRHANSLVVPLVRGTGGPLVALAGHLDVVRTEHEKPPRLEGDRLYGPGASDMKSGLALMLALASSPPSGTACDLTLVFYAAEEGPFADNELGPVLDAEPELSRHDLAICLEPSDNRLQLGCNGSLHARVTFRGRTAHSSRPWQGENAIHRAAPLLAALAAREPVEHREGDLVYRSVTSATMAEGGRGRNVVPDTFALNINHRFTPNTPPEAAMRDVRALVGDAAEVEFIDVSPSAPTFADHPLVRSLTAAGVERVEPKQAWTDVARFAARGVPAVNFGPGINAQAHQKNEYTSVALLHEGLAIFERFLCAPRPTVTGGHAGEVSGVNFRPIRADDDAAVAAIIRAVMPEFGADGPGFAIHDPEVDAMSVAYAGPRHAYYVVEERGRVVGGGGVAPLAGGDPGVCELRKMYFLPALRGRGIGARMLTLCLGRAREFGFHTCYLETLAAMTSAQRLYESFGFRPLGAPVGATGHFGCDRFYALRLDPGTPRHGA